MEDDELEQFVGMTVKEVEKLDFDWMDSYPLVDDEGKIIDIYDVHACETRIKGIQKSKIFLDVDHEIAALIGDREICETCGILIEEGGEHADEDGYFYCEDCSNDFVFQTDENGEIHQVNL